MGPLAALGPIGAIASMAEMIFAGPSFSQQMQVFTQKLQAMTPAQVAQARQSGFFGQTIEDINMARRAMGARVVQPTRTITRPSTPAPISLPAKAAPLSNSLLSTVAPKEVPVGFLSGLSKVFGGVGTAISDVRGIVSAIHPAATAAGKAATVAVDTASAAGKAVIGAAKAHPVLAAAGAASVAAAGIGAASMGGASGKMAAKQHLKNVAKGLGLHHRRMHATNVKALHRALRRVKGFERVARRVLRITMTKPHKVHFKFRRHKRAA